MCRRYHAAADDDLIRPLVFDYSTPVAIAAVSLLAPNTSAASWSPLGLLPWPFRRAQQPQPYDYLWSATSPQALHTGAPHGRQQQQGVAALSGRRAFQEGQELSVVLTLQLPTHYSELFQVTGGALQVGAGGAQQPHARPFCFLLPLWRQQPRAGGKDLPPHVAAVCLLGNRARTSTRTPLCASQASC